jgi:hypothetical protein
MLVCFVLFVIDIGIFLRHLWVVRRQLDDSWSLGMINGISQTDFRRLLLVAMFMIFMYFPITVCGAIYNSRGALNPYSWEISHAAQWRLYIPKESSVPPPLFWFSWAGPVTALSIFSVLGTTKNAIQYYKNCIDWISRRLHTTFRFCDCTQSCNERRMRRRKTNKEQRQEHVIGESVEVIALDSCRTYYPICYF